MSNLASKTEDHALEAVPDGDRQSWWQISWSTAGIGTTLIALFVGALATFAAGIKIGVLAGVFVSVIGGLLGWGMGHIAYRTGLSSSVLARLYGFGRIGSAIVALTFAVFIIGSICFENVMIYKGLIFWLDLQDNNVNRLAIYSMLTVIWILLTAFGFRVMARVASLTVVGFLGSLTYISIAVINQSGQDWGSVLSFGSQFAPSALQAMGIHDDFGKFTFCVNIMIGFAGGLALIDADIGRYARTSRDIGIAAFVGAFFLNVLMVIIGGMVMYAGSGQIIEYHVAHGMERAAATAAVLQSPDAVAAAFIIFGGALGGILMIMAQGKIQVLNTYSASLSLTSLFDSTIGWKPGRIVFVVGANMLACLMIYANLLHVFESFMTILGVLTTCFAAIILLDYFWAANRRQQRELAVAWNWAAVAALACSFILAHYVLISLVPIEFFTSFISTLILYPAFYLLFERRAKATSRYA